MSLEGDYDYDNIFVKILKGEIPSAKVFEDEHVLAFMDAFPQARGHTLVIPKTPSRNLFDTNMDELSFVIRRTQKVAEAVKDALKPDGIRLMQFNGAPAGQTVFHLHFHILPVYQDKTMSGHAMGKMADMNELEALAALIRAELEKDETDDE